MNKKKVIAIIMCLGLLAVMSVCCFATPVALDTAISGALATGVEQVQSDFTSILTTVLPVALGIGGIGIAIRLGWGFFKKIGK